MPEETGKAAGKPAIDSWSRLSEGLIAGIHHALNNRMGALRAVSQVVEADLPSGHALSGALVEELDRLERTASLLGLLGRSTGGMQPLQVEGVVADAARLFEMHHSLRDLRLETECSPGVLPVLANPESLLRGILLLLAIAARDGGSLRIATSGDERTVRITVTAGGDRPGLAAGELEGLSLSGAEEVLRRAGAILSVGKSVPARLEAVILTLPEARRMER